MPRGTLVWLIAGALLFYAYARWRGAIGGPVWAPTPAIGKTAAGS